MTPTQRPAARLGRLAAPCLALALAAACGEGRAPRLNVLLVTLDTTRADRIGCYGHPGASTPTIDALAARGARFERAVSTAGLTPMSHASILSGLNNYRHGLRVFYSPEVSHRLPPSVTTLPEVLAPRGYRSAGFTSAYPVSRAYGLEQGFDVFDSGVEVDDLDLTGQQRHETQWAPVRSTSTQRRADATVDAALGWLDAEPAGEPWCLWLHLFDAHDFSIVPPVDWAAARGLAYPSDRPRGRAEALDWRERMYDPEIAWMDEQLQRVIRAVEARGELDRTVIVVTADHGQGLTDGLRNHRWMKHRLLYDWCLRVPLVVAGPGIEAVTVRAQVRTTDVFPTLLELLDVASPDEVDGASLLPLVRGETEPAPRLAYADALNLYDEHSPKAQALPPGQYDNLYCLTDGRWKLVHHERDPGASELFDLAADPEELDNRYSPDHPEALRLGRQLEAWQVQRVTAPEGGSGPSDAALRSLGYGGADFGGDEDR